MSRDSSVETQGRRICDPFPTPRREAVSRFTTEDAKRFWAKVARTGSCWLWRGALNKTTGYGSFSNGRVPRNGRMVPWPVYAHRFAWMLTNGAIPAGQSVLHSCDVPACVNPAHLFIGTHRDNMRDAAAKGRLSVPRPSRRALTDDERDAVRRHYATGGVTMKALAAEYGVTPSHIWQIVHKKSVEFRTRRSA